MGLFRPQPYSLILMTLMFSVAACIPKKGGSSSSSNDKSEDTNTLSISNVRIGPGSSYPAEIYLGNYYSKYSPVVINGTCKGSVVKIQVQDTPAGGSASSQTVNCSNGSFSWTKNYTTEKEYALVLTPQDSSGAAIAGMTPISKTFTYDHTNPIAPAFVSPSFTNNYTITNGDTSVTIAGQVPIDVVKLVGPYSIILPMMTDPDGIHKNFVFNATVPASSSVAFTFTGYDAASNSASNTMTIDSTLNLLIPVAAQEIGGSHQETSNLKIESTVGFMSEVIVNSNVKQVTGSTGIMGNL